MDPFHEGEAALQAQAGSRARLAEMGGRVIRDHMPDQHREFFEQLPLLVVGALDATGQPWASVLAGRPGFAISPDPRHLVVRAVPQASDPLAEAITPGASIALLGIEPPTRRRNRMNGTVTERNAQAFAVEVGQSFGNCPKYIQAREPAWADRPAAPAARDMPVLDAAACALVEGADTFFIATAHPRAGEPGEVSHGVDVSHRGGKTGFVRVDGGVTLTVPDFTGNAYFNTLGNVLVNPRCGLLFIDYAGGGLLHVAARGEVVTDGEELRAFTGAQRLLRLHVEHARWRPAALPLRWGDAEMSPVLAATGAWG
jgi:predicted pyridoxine 5'-phosphate oxidase superfamily flavin-nucleotide-binding protein